MKRGLVWVWGWVWVWEWVWVSLCGLGFGALAHSQICGSTAAYGAALRVYTQVRALPILQTGQIAWI